MTKVLVVDDSSFARNALRRILENANFEVVLADSGNNAVELAPVVRPDIVTLDLLMPGLSGKETLVELKKSCPKALYIIVTADIQEITRRELMELGATAFLNKPVHEAALLQTIHDLLEKSQENE